MAWKVARKVAPVRDVVGLTGSKLQVDQQTKLYDQNNMDTFSISVTELARTGK